MHHQRMPETEGASLPRKRKQKPISSSEAFLLFASSELEIGWSPPQVSNMVPPDDRTQGSAVRPSEHLAAYQQSGSDRRLVALGDHASYHLRINLSSLKCTCLIQRVC